MFFIVEVENNDWWVWFVGGFGSWVGSVNRCCADLFLG